MATATRRRGRRDTTAGAGRGAGIGANGGKVGELTREEGQLVAAFRQLADPCKASILEVLEVAAGCALAKPAGGTRRKSPKGGR
jgi:hypothetical protein